MIMNSRNTSIWRRLLAAAILAVGFGALWFVVAIWIGVSALATRPEEARQPREILVVTADGTPLIQSFALDNPSTIGYRDLDGRDRGDVVRKDLASAVYLFGEREPIDSLFSRSTWPERIKTFVDETEPTAVWYFVHDGRAEGSGAFVGYERVGNRLIGYIGLAGFREHPVPPAERIPVRGEVGGGYAYWSSWQGSIYGSQRPARVDAWNVPPRLVHVPSGNLLRLVDLAARTTTTVFDAPTPISSVGIPLISTWSGSDPKKQQLILVRAGDKIYKLDREYHVVGVVTMPAEVGVRASVTWHEADAGRAVAECSLPKAGESLDDSSTRTVVYRIAADGTIQDSSEIALRNGSILQSRQAQLVLTALSLPAPAVLAGAGSLIAMQPGTPDYATRLGALLRRSWPALAAVLALACILAAVAWSRSGAFGLTGRERNAWTVFVLLLGAPGFVGFLLHRRWPPLEPCPHCHARCPRDREACAACGTPFPSPAPKGTEIFA